MYFQTNSLGHNSFLDVIVRAKTHFGTFYFVLSDYHFTFLYPEPWEPSIRSDRYIPPASPPSYSTFYRSAEQFEISLLNSDGSGYMRQPLSTSSRQEEFKFNLIKEMHLHVLGQKTMWVLSMMGKISTKKNGENQ